MHVEIRKLTDEGQDMVAGVLRLQGGKVVVGVGGDSNLLRGILSRPVVDARARQIFDADENPAGFLRALHQQYTSPYLRASEPLDDGDGGEALAHFYADHFNTMQAHGEPVTHGHLHDAAGELGRGNWRVTYRQREGDWKAHRFDDHRPLREWGRKRKSWEESKHPRGQPENKGEFATKNGSGMQASAPKKRPMEVFNDLLDKAIVSIGDDPQANVKVVESLYERADRAIEAVSAQVDDLIDFVRTNNEEGRDADMRKRIQDHLKDYEREVRSGQAEIVEKIEAVRDAFDDWATSYHYHDEDLEEERGDVLQEAQDALQESLQDFPTLAQDALEGLHRGISDAAQEQDSEWQSAADGHADSLNDENYAPEDAAEDAEIYNRELQEAGNPYRLMQDEEGAWYAEVPDEEEEEPQRPVQGELFKARAHDYIRKHFGPAVVKEAEHAPKGGIYLVNMKGEGKYYVGGQWIPAKEVANLPPAEKAKLEQAVGQAQNAAKMQRAGRGPIDPNKLQQQLRPHARELSDQEKTRAAWEAKQLHAYHGALTLHRIEQLAKQQQGFLKRANLTDKQKKQITGNLARLHAMIGMAQKMGVTGQVPKELQQQAATKAPPLRPKPEDYRKGVLYAAPAKPGAKETPYAAPAQPGTKETPYAAPAKPGSKEVPYAAPAKPEEKKPAPAAEAREKPKQEPEKQPDEKADREKLHQERIALRDKIKEHAKEGGGVAIQQRGLDFALPATLNKDGNALVDRDGRHWPVRLFVNNPNFKLKFESPAEKKEREQKQAEKPAEKPTEKPGQGELRFDKQPEKTAAPAQERQPGDEPPEEDEETAPAKTEPAEPMSSYTPRANLTHRQALAQAAKDARRDWSDKALLAGIPPKALHSTAEQVLKEDKDATEQRQHLLKRGRELLAHYGYNAQALTTNLRSGRVEDEVPGLDVVADSLQRSYPEQFAGHEKDPAQRLLEMFEEGVPQPMSKEDAYEKAFEYLHEQPDASREASNRPLWEDDEDAYDPSSSQWKSLREWLIKGRRRHVETPGQMHLFDESKHPRAPKGPHGGEFTAAGGASGQGLAAPAQGIRIGGKFYQPGESIPEAAYADRPGLRQMLEQQQLKPAASTPPSSAAHDIVAANKPDRAGLTPLLPALYDTIKDKHPGLTESQFHAALQQLQKEGEATLQTANDPRLIVGEGDNRYPAERYPRGGRYGGFLAWVQFRPGAEAALAKILGQQGEQSAAPVQAEPKVQAALDRYANHQPTSGAGLFAGDLEARRGFAKLPDGAPIVFTTGEFEGKTGKIVRDKDALTGAPRIVAQVEGRPGLVPISPDAIEPLQANLSWRVEGGGSGAATEQGGLYTADQFLPKREENNQSAAEAERDWKENGVQSHAFKQWFGDWENDPQNASKVVDENGKPQQTAHITASGEPIPVYHGTNADFESFSPDSHGKTDHGHLGKGFYFTDDKDIAGTYAKRHGGSRIVSAYLNIRNPYITRFKYKPPSSVLPGNQWRPGFPNGGFIDNKKDAEAFTNHLKSLGHDGIICINGNAREYVVFEPTQIKSVDNRGTFDSHDASINKSCDASKEK